MRAGLRREDASYLPSMIASKLEHIRKNLYMRLIFEALITLLSKSLLSNQSAHMV